MTDDKKKKHKSRISRFFRRKRVNKCEKKVCEEKKTNRIKLFGKGGHISRFFRKLNIRRRDDVEEEKNLVVEEEIEIFTDPIQSIIEERAAKKAARKEKRKKRMKRVRRAAFRTCHYIGMGASNMAPAMVYHVPSMVGDSHFNYNDPSHYKTYKSKAEFHWSSGIVLANW